MISDAAKLPDDPTALKQLLVDFQRHFDKETAILLEQIRLLRAQLYGCKSEKVIPIDGRRWMAGPGFYAQQNSNRLHFLIISAKAGIRVLRNENFLQTRA